MDTWETGQKPILQARQSRWAVNTYDLRIKMIITLGTLYPVPPWPFKGRASIRYTHNDAMFSKDWPGL